MNFLLLHSRHGHRLVTSTGALMGTHITRIGKYKFVSGLSWQSLSLSPDLWSEVTKLAGRMEANLITVRKSGATIQAGYTQLRERLPRSLYSLAAVISRTLAIKIHCADWHRQSVKNWLCALKLPDGKWAYCVVHHASFLPLYDFAGSREQVLACLYRDYGQGDRNIVIGNAELQNCGFTYFSAVRLEDLLPRSRSEQIDVFKWCALRPVEARAAWVQWSSVAGNSNIHAAFGIGGYPRLKNDLWKQEGRDHIAALCRSGMTDCMQLRGVHPISNRHSRSWHTGCLPRIDAMRTCASNKVLWPAWKKPLAPLTDEQVCAADPIMYAWRDGESLTMMMLRQGPSASYDATAGKSAHTESHLNETDYKAGTTDADTLLRSLTARFQLIALTIDVASHSTSALPAPAQHDMSEAEPAELSRPGWKTFSLTLNTGGLALADIAELLNYPVIRINKSVYRAGTWSIEGLVYAR